MSVGVRKRAVGGAKRARFDTPSVSPLWVVAENLPYRHPPRLSCPPMPGLLLPLAPRFRHPPLGFEPCSLFGSAHREEERSLYRCLVVQ